MCLNKLIFPTYFFQTCFPHYPFFGVGPLSFEGSIRLHGGAKKSVLGYLQVRIQNVMSEGVQS